MTNKWVLLIVQTMAFLLSFEMEVVKAIDTGDMWRKPPNTGLPNQTAPEKNVIAGRSPTPTPTHVPSLTMWGEIWENINEFYIKYPYFSSFITVGIKAGFADGVGMS